MGGSPCTGHEGVDKVKIQGCEVWLLKAFWSQEEVLPTAAACVFAFMFVYMCMYVHVRREANESTASLSR